MPQCNTIRLQLQALSKGWVSPVRVIKGHGPGLFSRPSGVVGGGPPAQRPETRDPRPQPTTGMLTAGRRNRGRVGVKRGETDPPVPSHCRDNHGSRFLCDAVSSDCRLTAPRCASPCARKLRSCVSERGERDKTVAFLEIAASSVLHLGWKAGPHVRDPGRAKRSVGKWNPPPEQTALATRGWSAAPRSNLIIPGASSG